MYNRHYSFPTDEEGGLQTEELRVFTMTIRPSLLNLHCQKNDYFKVIDISPHSNSNLTTVCPDLQLIVGLFRRSS